MHECLEEVEEENEYQEAEDIDQEVEFKDKGQKGIEIVHFTSSEATPPKSPSVLHFKWANPYDMNCLSPQCYAVRRELLMMIKLRLSLLPSWHLAQRSVQLSSVGRANAGDNNLADSAQLRLGNLKAGPKLDVGSCTNMFDDRM
ncbi:hypothetical protein PIB30_063166, partial [Stylosanthes scabra]|nr:hypothetical protein [Stylosanthes scabra]